MVAIMNEAAELRHGQSVLEVGGGSGYHAATVAEIVGPECPVFAIEIVESLVRFARENLARAGYANRVVLMQGDGSVGYPDRAPYDRIIVTAAAPMIPDKLTQQLKPGGVLVIPIGERFYMQELIRVRKELDGRTRQERLGAVAFVPLIGRNGFSE